MTNSPTFPIELINNTKIANDEDIFLIIKATNSYKKQCLVKIENNIGICESVTAETNSLDYSYRLTDLSKNQNGNYEFYLTQMSSGRVFLSIKYPLEIYIDSSNSENISIVDPEGFKTRDVNYYIIYDKFEFSYDDIGLFINPTAVDFFSIPLQILLPTSTSAFKNAGLTASRSEILSKVEEIFDGVESREEWNKLILKFGKDDVVLRVMAPGKAMTDTGPGSNPTFAKNYLSSDIFGLNYIDYVWNYYVCKEIKIDCSELKYSPDFQPKLLDGYIFEGDVEGDIFTFSNNNNEKVVVIKKPDSISFFSGSQGSFDFPNNSVGAIIVRELAAAFDVGLLPADDGALLNLDYFKSKKDEFYQVNYNIKGNKGGPWYNVYSEAFNGFEGQFIYTFAYGDALGQDGTLHDPNKNNIGKVTVKIGDLSGLDVPNPYDDNSKYTITVYLGENKHNAYYDLVYNGQTIGPGGPTILNDVSIPFKVKFNGIDERIYVEYPIVLPYHPITDGIVIFKDSQDSFTIDFPGPPADVTPGELTHSDDISHDDL